MLEFYIRSILLGIGLAMDACAVSMANGLNDSKMKLKKVLLIAFMFAFFQALMPLIGYVLGHAILAYIATFIPWISLILLLLVGGKMIFEGIKHKDTAIEKEQLTLKILLFQAVATSIDALSVGFTIAQYTIAKALLCAFIIAIITFLICFIAVKLGQKFGAELGNKAEIIGGVILIIIGIEIFITSFL